MINVLRIACLLKVSLQPELVFEFADGDCNSGGTTVEDVRVSAMFAVDVIIEDRPLHRKTPPSTVSRPIFLLLSPRR